MENSDCQDTLSHISSYRNVILNWAAQTDHKALFTLFLFVHISGFREDWICGFEKLARREKDKGREGRFRSSTSWPGMLQVRW